MLLTDILNTFVVSESSEPSTTSVRSSGDFLSLISSVLASHKDAILGILIIGLGTPATRLPAIHGLSSLIRIPTLLTDTELRYIVLETGQFVGKEPDEIEDVTYVSPGGSAPYIS